MNVLELRELKLTGVSDFFNDERIKLILEELPLLEDLYFGGYGVTDVILPSLSKLKNLRSIGIVAISAFTADGLLEYISTLGPGNQGLQMTVDMADTDSLLTDEEIVSS